MRKSILSILLLIMSLQVLAAPMRFRHITNREGLKYTWVWDIMEDSFGYMWFSTMYGAYRYNGFDFEDYCFANRRDSTTARVNFVYEDSSKSLWFGTNDGLYSYDRQYNTYTHYSTDANSPVKLASLYISDLVQDKEGNIWIGTHAGVCLLQPDGSSHNYIISKGLAVNTLYCDSRQVLWLGTTNGQVYYFSREANAFVELKIPVNIDSYINAIYEDSDYKLWFGTSSNGAICYNKRQASFQQYNLENGKLPSNTVRAISQDSSGEILLGGEKGLVSIDKQGQCHLFSTEDPLSINDNAIYCLLNDSNGNIWAGTFFGGVNVSYRQSDFFELLLTDNEEYQSSSKVVSSIIQNAQEEILVGTENNGLYIISESSTVNINGFKSDNIHSVCIDSYGKLWLGSYQAGIYMRSAGSKSFHNIDTSSPEGKALGTNNIYCIFNDSKGKLWAGSQYGGLSAYNYTTKSFENFPKDLPNSLFVWDILEDRSGYIWLACYGSGIYRLNPDHNYSPEKISTFSKSNFVSLCELSDGRIVAGTELEGIVIIDPISLDCKLYSPSTHKLPDNTVYSILQDDSGAIWFSTNSGLCKTDSEFQSFKLYTVEDGLPTNRFNYNASAKIDGRLYFGSINGIVVIDPAKIESENSPKSLRFGRLYINNNIEHIRKGGILSEDLNTISQLSLRHDQNSFGVDFASNSFGLEHNIQYAYKMQGLNNEWHNIGHEHRLDFVGLSPGQYKLQICIVDDSKLSLDTSIELDIVIKNIWWQSAIAKIIYIFLVIAIAYYIIHLIFLASRHKHELEIEKLDREKDKEINELKFNFFVNISHEFKTPLSLILGPVEQFLKDKVRPEQSSRYLSIIKSNANKLLTLINELLAFREVQLSRLESSSIELKPFIESILNRHSWLFDNKGIQLSLKLPDECTHIEADASKLEKIFDNLLSNAYKYTPADGRVELNFECTEQSLLISISNSGQGIAKDKLPYIFDHFFTSQSYDKYSSGVGLSYVKSLVELHKGRISAESLEGEYTCIKIELPLKQNELNEAAPSLDTYENSKDIFTEPSLNFENTDSEISEEQFRQLKADTTILIVEDDDNMRELIVDHFSGAYNVLSTNNGELAASMIRENAVDIVISDVMLSGGMSGFELCHYIKNSIETCHIRVILMTVLSEDDYMYQGYNSGADSYVVKPFSFELLELRVRNIIIGSYKMRQMYKFGIDLSNIELKNANSDEQLLKRLMDVIIEHLSDSEFGVNEICWQVSMSKATLYRKLKAITGQSINEFIQTTRLKYATRLLKETDKSISDIAYEVGFADPYYFSRSFKKCFGLSPKQWREVYCTTN